MKKYKHIFLLFLFSFPYILIGQSLEEESTPTYKNDLSINITKLLGNVLSITDEDSGVPYAFTYRRHNGKGGIRISLAGNFESENKNEVDFNRTLNKNEINLRIGYERIHAISNRLNIMYGLDVLGNYEVEKSEIISFQGVFEQKDILWEAGIGPSLRLSFDINDRVSLLTESSLYFITGKFNTENSSINIPDSASDIWSLKLSLPQALFITLAF